ncbi:YbhB/YbcL family Raf kinase inhibitor-like protein [Pseudodonghicola flavimaris]|uniref:Uncharacterized protein n=1 Tax=Pseudodonghicola flavimaris TaxID=3050036 RepID=A0ABT7F0B5_9RHOB|nr:hypothetical protein [Pseudodonghicola flavimaris]MDK3017945.1 hypothetical protein [Pseudodonghicola flavimaris]
MKWILSAALALLLSTPAMAGDFTAGLAAPWNGKTIPKGAQCGQQGGSGLTPPIVLSGLPKGTVAVLVEYDDRDYRPLSSGGGHGILLYPVKGSSATLPQVPEMTAKLPHGVRVYKPSRASGKFKTPGFIGPCSGGRHNMYTATIKPIDGQGQVLGKVKIKLGRY